jgi:hypothetical protein
MQIIEAEGRKFIVLRTINLEKFQDAQQANEFLHGMMYLRQANSNIIHIVDEILPAVFEDIPPEPELPVTSSATAPVSESINI